MRLKLTIAYDGRPFQGWQCQPGGNTVQDVLREAAREIGGSDIAVHGSGRTDTGVHALGQVAHFDPPEERTLTIEGWQRALNAKLPPTIRIIDATSASPDFHSRFDAVEKEYHYRIDTSPVLTPLKNGLVWHLPRPFEPARIEEACNLFVGTHDFRHFAANRGDHVESDPHDPVHTTRMISSIVLLEPQAGSFELRFSGSGFLYKMVRLLTGSALQHALGKIDLSWLRDRLDDEGSASLKSHHLAPAGGLYLASVHYPE